MNCGRRGVAAERFCTACGTELGHDAPRTLSRVRVGTPTTQLRAIRSRPCPHCARSIERDTPFCPHCGLRIEAGTPFAVPTCGNCGGRQSRADARFCAACGTGFQVPAPPSAVVRTPRSVRRIGTASARLALIDGAGAVVELIPSPQQEKADEPESQERHDTPDGPGTRDGRNSQDMRDTRETPASREARERDGAVETQRISSREAIRVAPLHGCGSMFVFITEPHALVDGDVLLIGSQSVRFRTLGSEVEPARAAGAAGRESPAAAAIPRDVAVLEQLRADGTVRDRLFVQAGRRLLIGRTVGDWVFPYDQTVSGRHAEVAPRAATQADGATEGSDWVLRDLGSRNGTGVAVRAPRQLRTGERLLVGGQMMRVESR